MPFLAKHFLFFGIITYCKIFSFSQVLENDFKNKNYTSPYVKSSYEYFNNTNSYNSSKLSQNETVNNPINNFLYNIYVGIHRNDETLNKENVRANLTFLNVSVTDLFIKNKEKMSANQTHFPNSGSEKDFFTKLFSYRTKMNSNNDSNKSSVESINERIGMFLKSLEESGKHPSFLDSESARKEGARQFQFVFHPYLPYGKEVMPDEKISIQDVLPVKMVKFIKSMVEEAPWEAMFMKMVRMIVDQFVDKIIEKMFANRDDADDKWRSADSRLTPTLSLSPVHTTVERLRRSAEKSSTKNGDRKGNDLMPESKMYETTDNSDNRAWLDLFLDYVFPGEDKVDDEKSKGKLILKSRKKRSDVLSDITENSGSSNLSKSEFIEMLKNIDMPSKLRKAVKDFLRYRILKRILRPLGSWRDVTDTKRVDLNAYPAYSMNMQPLETPFSFSPFPYSPTSSGHNSIYRIRQKRTPGKATDDEEDRRLWHSHSEKRSSSFVEGDETKLLWQSTNEIKPANHKRDECSLRRACNAGRLLARLPSVPDITLQLRSHHHEPHWDALLWGMKKKKCSKIFCSRQRSPKGSRKTWNGSEKRQKKNKFSATRKSKSDSFNDDMTTIISI